MLNIFKKNIKHIQKIVALVLIVTLYVLPFEIFAEPEKPINVSPANGSTDISLTPSLESSNYENIVPIESDISALSPTLWIDFSDASTVTTASGLISHVNDKSGSGYNFFQGNSTLRPSYESAVQNSLNVARFDGINDLLQHGPSNLVRDVPGVTIYVVRKFDATPTSGQYLIQVNTALSNARLAFYGGGGGTMVAAGRRLDANSFAALAGSNTIDTNFKISVGLFDYANSDLDLFLNKLSDGNTTSFQTNGNTSNTASNASAIGSTGGGYFFDGDIGEIILFHTKHNSNTRSEVLKYLNSKWGIYTPETHTASQWQITNTSGNYSSPVYDSGEDATNLESINIPSSTLSGLTTYYWRVKYKDEDNFWSDWSDETSFTTETDVVGSLSVDIVDAGGTTVGSPSAQMDSQTFSFSDQTSTGTFGTSSQKIRVDNGTGTATWTLSLAADIGATAIWDGTSADYDFNDPTASAADGGDTDSLGGQMTINPTTITITPEGGCTSTNISGGSSSAFSEGITDSITLASASSGADTDCYWDLTDISISQTIPAEQPADDYAIDMTLSIIAS